MTETTLFHLLPETYSVNSSRQIQLSTWKLSCCWGYGHCSAWSGL